MPRVCAFFLPVVDNKGTRTVTALAMEHDQGSTFGELHFHQPTVQARRQCLPQNNQCAVNAQSVHSQCTVNCIVKCIVKAQSRMHSMHSQLYSQVYSQSTVRPQPRHSLTSCCMPCAVDPSKGVEGGATGAAAPATPGTHPSPATAMSGGTWVTPTAEELFVDTRDSSCIMPDG
jgi:hypothetical protein